MSKPKRDWISPDNLDKAIHTLAFEVYHFRLFLGLCQRAVTEYHRPRSLRDKYPRSFFDHAFESSLYIHLRVLVAFFYGKNNKPDDVAATDFVPSFEPGKSRISNGQVDRLRKNLNKRVAHLSSVRFLEAQPESDDLLKDGLNYYVRHANDIKDTVEEFMSRLNNPQWRAIFEDRIRDLDDRNAKPLCSGTMPAHFRFQ